MHLLLIWNIEILEPGLSGPAPAASGRPGETTLKVC
jgi:hypothetical protein